MRMLRFLAAVLLALAAIPATAQPGTPAPPATTWIGSQVDGLFGALVDEGSIPGATVIVIQDGAVIHKAGYGLADIARRIPVDPGRTLFRVGSVSKLVTATAVMQLVGQGRLDLNADVNTYLTALRVEGDYPEPVTLANLLTHTAGFDDRYLGMAAPMGAPAETLAAHLARAMPPRVLPPGRVIAYSNYGIGLAGLVVETVSGEAFEAYARDHVFKPLGMAASGFGLSSPVPASMAVPYFRSGGDHGFRRGAYDVLRVGPAGDLVTTAGDMGRFMLAHLGAATTDGTPVLLPPTLMQQMHERHFANADGLDGWAWGFATGRRNGIDWLGHDGSWNGFCAQLVLHPPTRSGYFVAWNAECRFGVSQAIRNGLFDALWPGRPKIVAEPAPGAEARARAAEGTYVSLRRARGDFTALGAAASSISVAAGPGGSLTVRLPWVGRDLDFLPRKDGTWTNPEFQWKAAWRDAGDDAPPRFFIEAGAYERVTGLSVWTFWSTALALSLGICILTLWGWTSGFLSRRLFGEPQAMVGFTPRLTGFLVAGLVATALVSTASLLAEGAPFAILHGPTPLLMLLLSIPVVVGILAVPMLVWSVTGFGAGPRARLAQAGYILLTLAAIVFLAFCVKWGFHIFAVLAR